MRNTSELFEQEVLAALKEIREKGIPVTVRFDPASVRKAMETAVEYEAELDAKIQEQKKSLQPPTKAETAELQAHMEALVRDAQPAKCKDCGRPMVNDLCVHCQDIKMGQMSPSAVQDEIWQKHREIDTLLKQESKLRDIREVFVKCLPPCTAIESRNSEEWTANILMEDMARTTAALVGFGLTFTVKTFDSYKLDRGAISYRIRYGQVTVSTYAWNMPYRSEME